MGKSSNSGQARRSFEEPDHPDLSRNGRTANLPAQTPHKIFLWNAQGVYVDCAFPNPVHGHFFGGTKILGARLKDVFSPSSSQRIMQGITEALGQQERQEVVMDFQREGGDYRANIFLFPMDHYVMGWVMDHQVRKKKNVLTYGGPSHVAKDCASRNVNITEKELLVARAFGPGYSNRHIAAALQMSERTVKFHMANLLRKLDLSSRAHLAHLRLFESKLLDH